LGLARCRYRRLETPYLSDIDLIVSSHPDINVPNGFEKVPVDLNEASLKQALLRLRNQSSGESKGEPKGKGVGQKHPLCTDQELSQVKHQYVFLLLKRSPNPENAICDFRVVLSERKGQELLALTNSGWRAIESPVTPQSESQKSVFICFRHSKDALRDEREKMTLLIDVKPLVGKHKGLRPDLGYQKHEVDLRQVA